MKMITINASSNTNLYKADCPATLSPGMFWLRSLFLTGSLFLSMFCNSLFASDYLQPSQTNSRFSSKTSAQFVDALSNDRLVEQARLMRSTEMSATHRALNHQWLAVQSGQDKHLQGGKIASKLAQKAFKTYWKNKKSEEGSIRLSGEDFGELETRYNEVDYRLRVSKNTIKIKLKYEFD